MAIKFNIEDDVSILIATGKLRRDLAAGIRPRQLWNQVSVLQEFILPFARSTTRKHLPLLPRANNISPKTLRLGFFPEPCDLSVLLLGNLRKTFGVTRQFDFVNLAIAVFHHNDVSITRFNLELLGTTIITNHVRHAKNLVSTQNVALPTRLNKRERIVADLRCTGGNLRSAVRRAKHD